MHMDAERKYAAKAACGQRKNRKDKPFLFDCAALCRGNMPLCGAVTTCILCIKNGFTTQILVAKKI